MKRKFFICSIICLGAALCGYAQTWDFEGKVPEDFTASGKHSLSTSALFYKEGANSMEWQFGPEEVLTVNMKEPLSLSSGKEENYGIALWIYNEEPQTDSLRFEFLSPAGHVSYQFSFNLCAAGWRACWIGFQHMHGDKADKEIAGWRIVAPKRKGRVFIDRLTFPVTKMNLRTTPDQQMPYNNALDFRDLWHWCRVWQWEQLAYDIPIPAKLTLEEKKELDMMAGRLDAALELKKAPQKLVKKAYDVFDKANIRRSLTGFTGAPVVAPDELKRAKGELSWNDLETMLSGFAYDALYNGSSEAENKYFLVWDYAMDQGFAYGSGMGTNHHYGYQVRNIYTTAWLMRDKIWKAQKSDAIVATLAFWAALQETRQPCPQGRDELLDTWHTLLQPKVVSAMLLVDERERVRALKGLSRWVASSLRYTSGTIGGIKVDGTTFHHGGFYPAYTTGALAAVASFVALTKDTQYELAAEPRQVLKTALLAMRNYCNKYEWGIGISGRHPFGGSMREEDIASFASLALAGDLSGEGHEFDRSLAADYLRLCRKDTPEARYFRKQGIRPAKVPEGFFVYNYGAVGVFRRNDWMVTLKGYNTDVWGAEIYTKDNRYGRYQSYGSVQIMGGDSRRTSGYDENGWDWNRLPGATAIHLPFEMLDSPLKGTTMLKSKEHFSGASSFEGKNGMFATKLMERELKNFTPDFVARKSVFCFDNRMVFLGSGITNSNRDYSTETTLFQSVWTDDGAHDLLVDGDVKNELGFSGEFDVTGKHPLCLRDGYDNYYYIKEGNVKVQIARQESRHEKKRTLTEGEFASAWIDHGCAPQKASYEYLVWIQPSEEQLEAGTPLDSYEVLQCNDKAHIVRDIPTGITACAVFEDVKLGQNGLFSELPAETMVMYKQEEASLRISVCDPDLNIKEKSYTTKESSRPKDKSLVLYGDWKLVGNSDKITLAASEGMTELTVKCQDGQPVEFELERI